jgi:hypothetical protein
MIHEAMALPAAPFALWVAMVALADPTVMGKRWRGEECRYPHPVILEGRQLR